MGLSNRRLPSGQFAAGNRQFLLETGEFLRTAEDVRNVVVGVSGDRPIFLRNVADVADGGEEPTQYVRYSAGQGFRPGGHHRDCQAQGHQRGGGRGERAEAAWSRSRARSSPRTCRWTITRHYGETAAEKSNELLFHMLIAVVSVSILIAHHAGAAASR